MPDSAGETAIPIDELAAPARRALTNAGYTTLERLAEVHEAEVGELHGIGSNALETLHRALEAHDLSFRGDV